MRAGSIAGATLQRASATSKLHPLRSRELYEVKFRAKINKILEVRRAYQISGLGVINFGGNLHDRLNRCSSWKLKLRVRSYPAGDPCGWHGCLTPQ